MRLSVPDLILYLRERLELGTANFGSNYTQVNSVQLVSCHVWSGNETTPGYDVFACTDFVGCELMKCTDSLVHCSLHQRFALYSVLHYCVCSSDTDMHIVVAGIAIFH